MRPNLGSGGSCLDVSGSRIGFLKIKSVSDDFPDTYEYLV